MMLARYAAVQNAAASPREIELRAFRYVTGLLVTAGDVPGRATALHKTCQLWSLLLADLALPGNGLPDELKGKLISLGLWAQREANARMSDQGSLAPLIDLHRDMIAGLEAQAAPRPTAGSAPRPDAEAAARPDGQAAPRPDGQAAPRADVQAAPRPGPAFVAVSA